GSVGPERERDRTRQLVDGLRGAARRNSETCDHNRDLRRVHALGYRLGVGLCRPQTVSADARDRPVPRHLDELRIRLGWCVLGDSRNFCLLTHAALAVDDRDDLLALAAWRVLCSIFFGLLLRRLFLGIWPPR